MGDVCFGKLLDKNKIHFTQVFSKILCIFKKKSLFSSLSFVGLVGNLTNFIGKGHGIYDCLPNMLKIVSFYYMEVQQNIS